MSTFQHTQNQPSTGSHLYQDIKNDAQILRSNEQNIIGGQQQHIPMGAYVN
jgi:hypothetical protein